MRIRNAAVVLAVGAGLAALPAAGAGAAGHTVRVTALDRSGAAVAVGATLVDVATLRSYALGRGATRTVPDGTYAVSVRIDSGGTTTLGTRVVAVTRNTTVAFDARAGRKISVHVGDPTAYVAALGVLPRIRNTAQDDEFPALGWDAPTYLPADATYAIPTSSPRVRLGVHAVLLKSGVTPSPYRYDVVQRLTGIPAKLDFAVRASSLARVDMTLRSADADTRRALSLEAYPAEGGEPVVPGNLMPDDPPLAAGRGLTSYRTGGLAWNTELHMYGGLDVRLTSGSGVYAAGTRRSESWGGAAWGLTPGGMHVDSIDRRELDVSVSNPFCPVPVNAWARGCYLPGDSGITQRLRLYGGGGVLLAEGSTLRHTIPATARWYTLTLDARRSGGPLSTQVSATWRFKAKGAAYGTPPPAVGIVRFAPSGLNAANVVPGATTTAVGLRVTGLPDVATLAVWVSYDRGRTWHAVPAARDGARFVAHVVNPATDGTVSLRAKATSKTGASVTQTVVSAYGVRGTGEEED